MPQHTEKQRLERIRLLQKDYSKMTVAQLKDILIDMDLPFSGNKTKLIQRIKDNKK